MTIDHDKPDLQHRREVMRGMRTRQGQLAYAEYLIRCDFRLEGIPMRYVPRNVLQHAKRELVAQYLP